MSDFDPTLVSAVLETDEGPYEIKLWRGSPVDDTSEWVVLNRKRESIACCDTEREALAYVNSRIAALAFARRVMELEADNEKWFQVWSADIARITGERDQLRERLSELETLVDRPKDA